MGRSEFTILFPTSTDCFPFCQRFLRVKWAYFVGPKIIDFQPQNMCSTKIKSESLKIMFLERLERLCAVFSKIK